MELPISRRDVVGDQVAEYVFRRIGNCDPLGRKAYHHGEFYFVVQLFRHAGVDGIERDQLDKSSVC